MAIPHHILKESSIERALDLLLAEAINAGASEVILAPGARDASVRLRRDGLLHEFFRHPKAAHEAVLGRLKRLARLREDAPLAAQQARLRREVGAIALEGALAIVPVPEGEKAALRLWFPRPGFDALGLFEIQRACLRRLLRRKRGLLIVAGPRRSGRSTSLRTFLAAAERSAALIESEFEEDMPGIDQQATDPAAGRTAALLAREAFAKGAEVIGIDDLRDEAAAAVAVSASAHRLVIAALEAENASDALARLPDLGIGPRRLAAALIGVVAQRVLRRVCPECLRRETVILDQALASEWPRAAVRSLFRTDRMFIAARGEKCESCRFTGHRGLIGAFELLDLAAPGPTQPGLLDSAAMHVLAGTVAPEEALRL